ncbi:MAG: ribonuclease R [Candidatus Gastranaerophilales bacterium]|nr:ribonuclease R [Candidatus Gastranaerophilales bacterium]
MREKRKMTQFDGEKIVGAFIGHERGFGFVEAEGREADIFIRRTRTGGAFHGDTVEVVLLPPKRHRGGLQEGKVVRILERGLTRIVGTYEQSGENFGFVTPDISKVTQDIFVAKESSKGAVSGHKVVVELTDYGDGGKSPEGKIVEILGHENDPGVDIMAIVRGYELPMEFDERVLEQAERVAKPVSEADRNDRRDLREVTMVTIDGEDAKDLDDAVSLSFDGEQYHLGVHIADVTNYVQENSALDREAKKRGTSVYLVDRVIPMLPHALSNGICSLNAGEDRLAVSCLMTIDSQGEIVDHEIVESVICVNQRMTYTAVKEILQDESVVERDADYRRYAPLVPMFRQMETLAAVLRAKRKARGSIDFDFPECKISLDKEGHPVDIRAYERNVATDIIEDFMLAANETVAQHFYWMELPFVYRVHDVPDKESLRRLVKYIGNLGYSMKTVGRRGGKTGSEEVHPKEIQKLLAKVAGTPEEPMVSRLALRSMKQAKYSVRCSGHFGLACQYYCHFTSPIRRYPDLQIHRIIKEQLRGRMTQERIEHYKEILPEAARISSTTERRADEAERETDKLKKVEYMEERLGMTFDGVICGLTRRSIFVELPNTVEGRVDIHRLPGKERYYYDEAAGEIVGKNSGRTYRLGMALKVKVLSCDRTLRAIEFEPVGKEKRGEDASWRREKRRRR